MKKILLSLTGALMTLASVEAQEEITLSGKQLFGDLKARQIGPALMSGRFIDLEAHPTNNRILYAGAAGGGAVLAENTYANHSYGTCIQLYIATAGQDRAGLLFSSANSTSGNKDWMIGNLNGGDDFRKSWRYNQARQRNTGPAIHTKIGDVYRNKKDFTFLGNYIQDSLGESLERMGKHGTLPKGKKTK